ncbi:TatD family hydrolase [Zavarzinia compransoris]|uniref:LuxR family transcriptional regulator n=1 Tax=Zavarzinia compransoris TaxID=1264899 RepID=A0A317DZ56_9PROT|nr:TatD family hydrolase [Zavarzinia compransoris]PWR19999.1 LuxR family transcriptional regulator [Zavarzinia compransoris]TDP44883.1 TatD DNase family protein [Zavarzinia compransoris]
MLIDSHCHLDFPNFAEDLDQVVARARAAGVGAMLTIGTTLAKSAQVIAVAERFPNIWASVGIHPHEAEAEPDVQARTLVELSRHPKVIAIGETGLDYFYEHAPRDAQKANFRAHIQAARETGLPIIIHTRDADDDTAAILRDEVAKGEFPGLIHCFTSGAALAEVAVELGLYISFSGIVTFKTAANLREIAARVPAGRLLVETDSPYLAPIPHRGKRNEPAFVADTAKVVAAARGIGTDELAALTTANFTRLFTKANVPAALAA